MCNLPAAGKILVATYVQLMYNWKGSVVTHVELTYNWENKKIYNNQKGATH